MRSGTFLLRYRYGTPINSGVNSGKYMRFGLRIETEAERPPSS